MFLWHVCTQGLSSAGGEEMELTFLLSCIDFCRVDALTSEEALCLQDENKRSPSKHQTTETQALQHTRGKGEAVSHPYGPAHTHTGWKFTDAKACTQKNTFKNDCSKKKNKQLKFTKHFNYIGIITQPSIIHVVFSCSAARLTFWLLSESLP